MKTKIRRLIIGSNRLQRISEHAFEGCEYLTHVFIQDGVKVIEDGAFSGCSALKMHTYPGFSSPYRTSGFCNVY